MTRSKAIKKAIDEIDQAINLMDQLKAKYYSARERLEQLERKPASPKRGITSEVLTRRNRFIAKTTAQ